MISWTRRALLAALALVALLAPAAVADAQAKRKPVDLTVMTRNIYLGGNIFGPIGAPTQAEFEARASALWAEVRGTDFPTRAKLIAGEIRRTKPALIGLQEVALWRRSPDGVKDGQATPATQVAYDFLPTLQSELRRAGLRYRVAVRQEEANIEASIADGYDVRLTMYDVILVRRQKALKITGRLKANYEETVAVPIPNGDTLTSTRGWTAVDARFKGKRLRFVNTHLEAFGDAPREAQARELVARGGPLRTKRQLIVVGDFNSDPQGRESPSGAFDILARFGLVDTWPRRFGPGFSCCLNQSDARDPDASGFDHRIDLILAKPKLRAIRGRVVGNRTSDRAANGLWPSDHAGVVTTLRLR